jgi:F0F1-type ATP synthase alpha subunit
MKLGKTSIAIDTIINQRWNFISKWSSALEKKIFTHFPASYKTHVEKSTLYYQKKNLYCIYVSIGQKRSSVAFMYGK